MAEEYAGKGFEFVFVYTREAHPGQHYPAHRSMEQKLAHARGFQEQFDIRRPILVDDLLGTGHRLYGQLPNMTYLIGRGGQVLYRADWTDANAIRNALEYFLDARARRRDGLRLAPFHSEMVGYRWNDPAAFQTGLLRAGRQAVDDFAAAMQRWTIRGRNPGRIDPGE